MSEQEEFNSFLDYNLDEVPDLEALPAGEYQLKIEDATVKESKGEKTAGQNYLNFRYSVPGEDSAKPIYDIVMLPSEEEDKATNDQRKRALKYILQAAGWDTSRGFNIEELVGETLYAILETEEDSKYGERNNVQRYVVPENAK